MSSRRLRPASRTRWPLRPRLGAPPTPLEALRIERVIATARLLLLSIGIIAFLFDPTHTGQRVLIFSVAAVLYLAHTLAALFALRARQKSTPAFSVTVHVIDLIGAAALTLPAADPDDPFFPFFFFVLAAAAFRWGFWETVATSAGAIVLVFADAAATSLRADWLLGSVAMLPPQLVARLAYLAAMGILLGYIAEETQSLRAESSAIVGLLGQVRIDAGLTRMLDVLAAETVWLFRAGRLSLFVEHIPSRRLFQWDSYKGWAGPGGGASGEVNAALRETYLFGPADQSFAVDRRRWPRRRAYRARAIDPAGRVVSAEGWSLPAAFLAAHPFRCLISAPVGFGDEWRGRVFLFDPRLGVRSVALAQFLRAIVRQVGPAVFNVYLLSRLRSRAGAIERARVARELHDGVIQSLVGVEMQLEVLRGAEAARGLPAAGELAHLKAVVHDEVLNLRDLMNQMRQPEFDPKELVDYLAQLVDRFGRDNGLIARFSSGVDELTLPRHVCFELVRILQEALVNIRKHSGATIVVVRFGLHDGYWVLEVDDNGTGFPFEGEFTHAELDVKRAGPIVIKERVRAIGAELDIVSASGSGARLRVRVPKEVGGR